MHILYVFVYMCEYVCVNVCLYVFVYVCVNVCMYGSICVWVYVGIHVCVHVCMYVCTSSAVLLKLINLSFTNSVICNSNITDRCQLRYNLPFSSASRTVSSTVHKLQSVNTALLVALRSDSFQLNTFINVDTC
jgi:hypothetical protein